MSFTVTLDDQDPEGFMPVHWWGVRLEYDPRPGSPELPGGSWSMSAPGEHWARIMEAAFQDMSAEDVYAIVDAYPAP